MKADYIPLPLASLGREYIIDHIKSGKTSVSNLSGYGILPGIKIKLLFTSPFSDPCAYEVMGSVLALRREDSKNIFIRLSE